MIDFPTLPGQSLEPDPLLRDGPPAPSVFRIQPPYGEPVWLVTRMEDVRAMLTDPRFSRAATIGVDVGRTQPYVMREETIVGMDAPQHTRVRRAASAGLTARRVEALRPRAQEIVDGLLDALDDPAELVEGLCLPLPITVICELLGVPYEDRVQFRGWADTFMTSSGFSVEEVMAAHANLHEYLAGMLAARRENPTDDLLGALVGLREQDALNDDELLGMALALLVGGFETTASQLAKFVLCLLVHRDQWDRVVADPSLVPNAVEELLRFVPLAGGTSIAYVAAEDVELGGVTIKAGDGVMASGAAANRDPDVFARPTDLDVGRADVQHMGFGHGAHYCLGANLARMELQVAIGTLARRFPAMRLAVEPQDVPWKGSSAVWGLVSLPVRLRG